MNTEEIIKLNKAVVQINKVIKFMRISLRRKQNATIDILIMLTKEYLRLLEKDTT